MLMAISKQTKNINEVVLGDKIKNKIIEYIPHGLNHNIFYPIQSTDPKYQDFLNYKKQTLNGKEYDFVLFFNSRNIRRKQIPDTLLAFRMFLDKLPKEKADKCCLLLHTQKIDENGTDLPAVSDYLLEKYPNSVVYHEQNSPPDQMNWLYNMSDAQILLTSNEGWGLSLTEAILAGKPIIANQQGGMIDQMRFEDENGKWIEYNKDFPSNHRNTYKKHGEWAFPVLPSNISIQGSPLTPYISDDRCRPEDASERIYEVYNMSKEERERRGLKGREWAMSDEAGLTSEKMGQKVINCFDKLFETWQPREKSSLINATKYKPVKSIDHPLIY